MPQTLRLPEVMGAHSKRTGPVSSVPPPPYSWERVLMGFHILRSGALTGSHGWEGVMESDGRGGVTG